MQIPKIDEIKGFLSDFKQKLKVYGVVYHRSDDNTQTIADLDINPVDRKDVLLSLHYLDFYKGPNPDQYDPYGSPVWEFGKVVKKKEVYIKISLGTSGKPVVCKSFHFPKRIIKYPFKKEGSL